MARWRRGPVAAEIPAWVFTETGPEVDEWLDETYANDPDGWFRALQLIMSTPVYAPPVWE